MRYVIKRRGIKYHLQTEKIERAVLKAMKSADSVDENGRKNR